MNNGQRAGNIYRVLVLMAAGFLLLICLLIIFLDYQSLIRKIVEITEKPEIAGLLEKQVLPVEKFKFIQGLSYFLIFALPLIVLLLFRCQKLLTGIAKDAFRSILSAWTGVLNIYYTNSRRNNYAIIILLAIICVKSLYYIITWDLQYDEAWSYNYFTAQPFYFSFVAYSNYPLYELSTQLFKWLPFSMKINLRLPVLLIGLLTCFMLYALLIKTFKSSYIAVAGTAIFAFMPVTTFYMLYARGVIFELFFALTALFSLLFWVKENKKRKYLIIYIASNVLGVYSMPTHLFFWIVLLFAGSCYTIMYYSKGFRTFILANCLIIIFCIICYLPIAAGSGFSFINNALKEDVTSVGKIIEIYLGMSQFFTGFKFGLIVLFFISILLFPGNRNTGTFFILGFSSLLCLLPVFIHVMQKYHIPERALAFTGLAIPLLVCVAMKRIEPKIGRVGAIFIICILSVTMFINSNNHSFLNWSRKRDKLAIILSNLFLKSNIVTCYDNSGDSDFFYYYPLIEYYFRHQNKSINFAISSANSARYKKFNISDRYDCIVVKSNSTEKVILPNYRTLFTDSSGNFTIIARNK